MKNLTTSDMDNLFEKHFSSAHTDITDMDALWGAIEQKQQPSRKFPLLWWLIGFGGLTTSLLGIGLYVCLAPNQLLNNETVSPLVFNTAILSTASEAASSTAPLNSNQQTTKKDKSIATNIVSPIIATKPIISNQSTLVVLKQNELNNKANLSQPFKANNTISTKQKIYTVTNKVNSFITDKNPFINNKNISNYNSNPSVKSVLATTNLFDKNAINRVGLVKEIHHKLPILAQKQTLLLQNKISPVIATKMKQSPTTSWDKCIIKKRGHVFMQVYGQASLPLEQVSYNLPIAAELSDTYKTEWQEKFTPFVSYLGGMQLGYVFPSNISLSGGLAYQLYQTKYETSQRIVEQITIYEEMAYFYTNELGETIWVADSVTITNIYDQTATYANKHKMWHLPLQLGYSTTKQNIRYGGNIEALLNLSKHYDGYFLTQNSNTLEIDANNEATYMATNLGISFSAGLHIGYLFGSWEAYVNPRFRINKNSFLADNQSLKITNNFAGLRLGLSYTFGK